MSIAAIYMTFSTDLGWSWTTAIISGGNMQCLWYWYLLFGSVVFGWCACPFELIWPASVLLEGWHWSASIWCLQWSAQLPEDSSLSSSQIPLWLQGIRDYVWDRYAISCFSSSVCPCNFCKLTLFMFRILAHVAPFFFGIWGGGWCLCGWRSPSCHGRSHDLKYHVNYTNFAHHFSDIA